MIAIDTNILVRYLINDDEQQTILAVNLLKNQPQIWVSKTVFLETEWVLRAVYKIEPNSILKGFSHILGLPNIIVEQESQLIQSIMYYREGMDFADALHFVSSQNIEKLYTFERNFVKTGQSLDLAIERLE